jgi:hypothetical protein
LVHTCFSAGTIITETTPLTTHRILFKISVSPSCKSRFRERKGKYKFQFSQLALLLFDIPHLIQTGLHEGVQWTLLSPRTLRADGAMRLYNNGFENFVLMVSQLHQNLESTQATLGSFQSPLCGEARVTIICNSRYGEIVRC